MADRVVLREARPEDIPALLFLLLTSFRRFPLFDYLYAPLRADEANASDTIYFWGKRLRKTLWDPTRTIIVAEIRDSHLPSEPPRTATGHIDQDSWSMLRWIENSQSLPLSGYVSGSTLVAFSIWELQGLAQAHQEKARCHRTYFSRFQGQHDPLNILDSSSFNGECNSEFVLDLRIWYCHRFYTRKDQDPVRYQHYLEAENELEKRYHYGVFLYLDNICVDFRLGRTGIGRRLLEWGIQEAATLQVPIKTETTSNNVSFYENSGFQDVGQWSFDCFEEITGMSLHVMQKDPDIP